MSILVETKDQVVRFLGITPEEYHQQVWEAGNAFALHYTGDQRSADMITASGAYWDWFENQFCIVDQGFLKLYIYHGQDPAMLKAMFQEWLRSHAPEQMVAYPNPKIVRDSYAEMIEKAISQAQRKEVKA